MSFREHCRAYLERLSTRDLEFLDVAEIAHEVREDLLHERLEQFESTVAGHVVDAYLTAAKPN